MTLRQFIKKHRQEIDAYIGSKLRNFDAQGKVSNPIPTDAERRLWVLNDEALYFSARQEGVRI